MYVLLLLALDDSSSLGPDEKLAAGSPFLVTLLLLAFKMLVLLVKIELVVDDEVVNLFDEFISIAHKLGPS